MPTIKDKYNRKAKLRPKYVTREINRAIEIPAPTGVSTQQKQEEATKSFRRNPENKAEISATGAIGGVAIQESLNIVSNFTFSASDTTSLIFILSKGQSLKDILIHNYNATGNDSTIITLAWSTGDQSLAKFTVTSGKISAFAGITLNRFFGSVFPHLATVSLKEIVNDIFNNVHQDIYFYGVSTQIGTSITFSKH